MKKPQKKQLGTVVIHEICWFKKCTCLLICKLPFSRLVHEIALEVGHYAMHFQVHTILTLQEAAEAYMVGLLEDANLYAIHAKCVTTMPKNIIASLAHPWRTPFTIKFILLPKVCFSLSVDCRLCGILQVQVKETNLGITLYIFIKYHEGFFLLIVCK